MEIDRSVSDASELVRCRVTWWSVTALEDPAGV